MVHVAESPGDLTAIRTLQAGLAGQAEFAFRMGRVYLDLGLPDAAIEALTAVPEAGEAGQRARLLRLEVLARQGAHARVLELGRELGAELPGAPWLWKRMATAAFAAGDRAQAEAMMPRALAYLPSAEQVAQCLADAEPGREQPEPLALVRSCAEAGMGPHATVDSLLPVIWEARSTTCLFEDGIAFVEHAQMEADGVRKALLGMVREFFVRYGVRTAFLRYAAADGAGLQLMGKVYFSRSPDLHEAVDRLERLHWEDFRRSDGHRTTVGQALRAEGALLGYPACCVEWAARLRDAGKSLEIPAAAALLYAEGAVSALADPRVPSPAAAYHAFEFYPCDPRCPAAEARGHHLLERVAAAEAGFAAFVRERVLPLNKARVWQAGKTAMYPQFVRAFNAELFKASLPEWQRSWLQADD